MCFFIDITSTGNNFPFLLSLWKYFQSVNIDQIALFIIKICHGPSRSKDTKAAYHTLSTMTSSYARSCDTGKSMQNVWDGLDKPKDKKKGN